MTDQARVLIVDDQEMNLDLLEEMLLPLGHQVVRAGGGEEALKKVAESAPDLILLDIMMPGLDGFEAARRLKKAEDTWDIPIVMVTALNETPDRVRALEAGADDFLTKPVDRTELRARVASLLQVKAYRDLQRDQRRYLEAEVARRTDQLNKALERLGNAALDTIHRLSTAAEYRDEDTGAHIVRMSRYSAAIAREMGLNDQVVDSILYSAPMHDVGKIGIPDRILLKPGKLNKDEWRLMKRHTTIGGAILGRAKGGFIKLGEVIALTHHERWDGSGYPRGLKGAKIPLAGRIVAVADVFDALTSRRPYKEPFPQEQALDIIRSEAGAHFDPAVVEAFFGILEEIKTIKATHADEGAYLPERDDGDDGLEGRRP